MFKGLKTIVERRLADKDFIENLIKEPVEDFSCSLNSKDGFMGYIKCIVIKTKTGSTYNLVYKGASHVSDTLFSYFSYFQLGTRENAFYKTIAPQMENMCKSSLPTPKMYDCLIDGKTDFLVLEDLRPLGFRMPEKYPSLTFDETKMILQKLAAFSAQGFHFMQEPEKDFGAPEYKDALFHHFYQVSSEPTNPHWPNYNRLSTDIMKVINDRISVDLAKKMNDICSRTMENINLPWKYARDGKYFSVICHGDLWPNNVLFKYSPDGKPLDVKFIDFQNCHVGSIYEDLYYFIFTSTSPEFRKEHLNSILDIYYGTFMEELKRLGNQHLKLPDFTREKFNEEFFENAKSALAFVVFSISFHLGVFPPTDDSRDKKVVEPKDDDIMKLVPLYNIFEDFNTVCPIAFKNSERAITRLLDVIQEFSDLGIL